MLKGVIKKISDILKYKQLNRHRESRSVWKTKALRGFIYLYGTTFRDRKDY